jgi:hypothetical protein
MDEKTGKVTATWSIAEVFREFVGVAQQTAANSSWNTA